jgi:hypothetical protein
VLDVLDGAAVVVVLAAGTDPNWNFWVVGGGAEVGDIRFSGARGVLLLVVALFLLTDVLFFVFLSVMGPLLIAARDSRETTEWRGPLRG